MKIGSRSCLEEILFLFVCVHTEVWAQAKLLYDDEMNTGLILHELILWESHEINCTFCHKNLSFHLVLCLFVFLSILVPADPLVEIS